MEAVFNEAMIREELKRLDQKTGLNAASLPIKFGKAKSYLAYFSFPNENSLEFYFSNHYFLNPMFPVEEKIDTIRHEYAHYMDYFFNGSSSHGPQWKKYAKIVGACPIKRFSQERADYFLKKHQEERETNIKCDSYVVGDYIYHPDFGLGIIEDILGEGVSRIASIHFNNGNRKKLSLKWIAEKCMQSNHTYSPYFQHRNSHEKINSTNDSPHTKSFILFIKDNITKEAFDFTYSLGTSSPPEGKQILLERTVIE